MKIALFATVIIFLPDLARATERRVPEQYPSIQAGIDAAVPGDTVLVSAGNYSGPGNYNITFRGKTITVHSSAGPAQTIVNASSLGSGFVFSSFETVACVLDGFTVTNGYAPAGGGILCEHSSPTIRNCRMLWNWGDTGGGLHLRSQSSPAVSDCIIASNQAGSGGSGLHIDSGAPNFSNCLVVENNTYEQGAGVFCVNTSSTFDRCMVLSNVALYGMYFSGCTSCVIRNSVVGKNTGGTNGSGSGLVNFSSVLSFLNCTVAGNGGSGFVEADSSNGTTIANCIFADNARKEVETYAAGHGGPVLTLKNCCVKGGTAKVIGSIVWENSLTSDPGFALAADHHLLAGSPCVDAGTNNPPGGLPAIDLEGTSRPQDGNNDGNAAADIGAYELEPAPGLAASPRVLDFVWQEGSPDPAGQTISIRNPSTGTAPWQATADAPWVDVSPASGDASGSTAQFLIRVHPTGLSGGKHFSVVTLQQTGGHAVPIVVNLRATGTIRVPADYPTIQGAINAARNGDTVLVADGTYRGPGNRHLDFSTLMYGSDSRAITIRSEHGPEKTMIDCERLDRGIVFDSAETRASIFDGFTIINGQDTGVYTNASYTSPTIRNCIIRACGGRGGIYVSNGSPLISDCTIVNNWGSSAGGIESYGNPTIRNCIIARNEATHAGGIAAYSATITNCIIAANVAYEDSGGLGAPSSSSPPTLTNCIIWGNSAPLYPQLSGVPAISYSCIQGGYGGTGNISADPGLALADDYHLLPGSSSIDAGTNTPAGGLEPLDFENNSRTVDGNNDGSATTDLGIYESDPLKPALALSPAGLNLSLEPGQSRQQKLQIRNASVGTLAWTLQSNVTWLTLSSAAGDCTTETDEITATVDASSLVPGDYLGAITCSAPGAANPLRVVAVRLHVSRVLRVPSAYSTIQAGINAAVDGDVVLVADGVYRGTGNRALNFGNGLPSNQHRVITVRSEHGPAWTIVDCQRVDRGFNFTHAERRTCVLDGLTILNGRGTGGGIYIYGSSPTIRNCVLRGAVKDGNSMGGGLYIGSGRPLLLNCLISDNRAGGTGGGIYCEADATIQNCIVVRNFAAGAGGIRIRSNSALLVNSLIVGNESLGSGGGISVDTGYTPTLTNCTIRDNITMSSPQIVGGSPLVSWSNVQGGYSGSGNFDADPLFALADDYHVQAGSPCIDAGLKPPFPGLSDLDFDEDARVQDGNGDSLAVIDAGPYEFSPSDLTLAISPSSILQVLEPGTNTQRSIQIRTIGSGSLSWTAQSNKPWLLLTPGVGASAGEIDELVVTLDTAGLLPGDHDGVVTISAPGAVQPIRSIAIRLHVAQMFAVPSAYPTIQAAIDAAGDGDTVLVADGTYSGSGNTGLEFGGKALLVRSQNGAAACTIDCYASGAGCAFSIVAGETRDSIIDGFTITRASRTAITVYNDSRPTIRNCVMRGNSVSSTPAAVIYADGAISVENCLITGNTGVYCGLRLGSGNSVVSNCRIVGNTGTSGAAVMFPNDWACTMTNCLIMSNNAPQGGFSGQGTITNSIIWGNGPGSLQITGTPQANYSCVQNGFAGVGNISSDPGVTDMGGDYHLTRTSPCIDAGTNAVSLPDFDFEGEPRVLDGNGDSFSAPDMGPDEFDPGSPRIGQAPTSYSITLELGQQADLLLQIRNLAGGSLSWTVSAGCDWATLQPAAGESTGEIDSAVVHVNTSGLSAGPHLCDLNIAAPGSVNTPQHLPLNLYVSRYLRVPAQYATLQAAINAAVAGDVVLVADGTYTGSGNRNISYAGKAIKVRSEHGPAACIIDCQNAGRGFLFVSGDGPSCLLEGLTILRGSGTTGGAISCVSASPVIRNCILRQSNASTSGGGIHAASSDVILDRCVIDANTTGATGQGGGVYVIGGYPKVYNCRITANTARTGGGVVAAAGGKIDLVNCLVGGNTATLSGGGAYLPATNPPGMLLLTNSTIVANQAGLGGGLYSSGVATLVNSIISGNSATGGPQLSGSCSIGCTGTVFNVSFCLVEGGPATASVSPASALLWGIGNLTLPPMFMNPAGLDSNPATWLDNDYRLSGCSLGLDAGNNTLIAADAPDMNGNGDIAEAIPDDLAGRSRRIDAPASDTGVGSPPMVDLGAYEFDPEVLPSVPADFDQDCDVDETDLESLLICMAGADVIPAAGCVSKDLDMDSDVDQSDFAQLQRCLSGTGIGAKDCTE